MAVLDTSPFKDPRAYGFNFVGSEDFTLCVSHPDNLADEWAESGLLGQHGTSVASLVRTTAPMSQIHLIRVLDSDAKADLFALLRGLELVFAQAGSDEIPELSKTVVNLSLGYQANIAQLFEQEDTPPEPLPTELAEWVTDNALECEAPAENLSLALCLALDVLAKRGATLIAAAGNNSQRPAQVLSPNLPAAWDHVMAAGATNSINQPSCFSNDGEVWAPGGDGVSNEVSNCVPDGDPAFYVITLSLIPRTGTGEGFEKDVGYALWAGTSFAAPVVSGMAACLLASGEDSGVVVGLIVNSMPANRTVGFSVDFGVLTGNPCGY